jgi:hypothetical protein
LVTKRIGWFKKSNKLIWLSTCVSCPYPCPCPCSCPCSCPWLWPENGLMLHLWWCPFKIRKCLH